MWTYKSKSSIYQIYLSSILLHNYYLLTFYYKNVWLFTFFKYSSKLLLQIFLFFANLIPSEILPKYRCVFLSMQLFTYSGNSKIENECLFFIMSIKTHVILISCTYLQYFYVYLRTTLYLKYFLLYLPIAYYFSLYLLPLLKQNNE